MRSSLQEVIRGTGSNPLLRNLGMHSSPPASLVMASLRSRPTPDSRAMPNSPTVLPWPGRVRATAVRGAIRAARHAHARRP